MVLTSSSRKYCKYCRLVSGLASMVNAIEEEPQAGAFGPIQLVAVRLQGFLTALLALLCPSQKRRQVARLTDRGWSYWRRLVWLVLRRTVRLTVLLCVVLRRCAWCSAPLCPVWCSVAQCSAVQCSAALCCFTMLHYALCTVLHYALCCTLHCAMLHYALCTVLCCTMHYALCTCTMHLHYALRTYTILNYTKIISSSSSSSS